MPIYEYACTACGHRLEVIHGIHESGPSKCDVCGGPMTKLLSPPAIVFRGTGWAKKERASSGPAESDGRSEAKPGAQPRESGTPGQAGGSGGGGEAERSAGGAGEGGRTAGTSTSRGRAGPTGSRGRAGSGGSDGGGSSSER